jgi:hypothetical protein
LIDNFKLTGAVLAEINYKLPHSNYYPYYAGLVITTDITTYY